MLLIIILALFVVMILAILRLVKYSKEYKTKSLLKMQEEHMDDFGEKHLELMNTRFSKDAEKYLLTDEEIIQCFGLLVDFACLTNKRLFFIDKKLTKYKNEVVSIPFREIKDVRYEQKLTLGEVKIITRSDDFDIKMDRGTVKMFADAVLAKIL